MGCEEIIGLEARHLAEGGAGGSTADAQAPLSEQCEDYCSDVMESCTEEFAVYGSKDLCIEVCRRLPEGEPGDMEGNSVACRAHQARLAGQTREPDVHCPHAGPGGGTVCGSNCEGYCMLMPQICPDEAVSDCERKCQALPDDGTFDVVKHHDGDYLQCRLVHLSSATVSPEAHCWHAEIAPRTDSRCSDPADEAPACEDYCRLVMTSCTDDLAVYESLEQCEAACAALPKGGGDDTTADTVGCRRYHAYSSLEAPTTHCPHAGPTGDGHCGEENCPSYCTLVAAACPNEFATAFASVTECLTACADVPGAARDSGYSVVSAETGDSLQCRVLHAARAFENASECASAFGGGSCQ